MVLGKPWEVHGEEKSLNIVYYQFVRCVKLSVIWNSTSDQYSALILALNPQFDEIKRINIQWTDQLFNLKEKIDEIDKSKREVTMLDFMKL